MTGFDVLVLIIVGVSALLAFARGFIRELLSMAALAIAILAVLWGLPVLREPVRKMFDNDQGWIADTITVVGLFVVVYVAVRVLTGRIHEWVHDSEPLGMLDRTAGILFGVARGFIIMAIGVLIITSIAKESMRPRFLTSAKFYPFLVLTGEALKSLAPSASSAASDLARSASQSGTDIAKWRSDNENPTNIGNEVSNSIDDNAEKPKAATKKNEEKPKKRENALTIEPEK